jgi:hypothetical protein
MRLYASLAPGRLRMPRWTRSDWLGRVARCALSAFSLARRSMRRVSTSHTGLGASAEGPGCARRYSCAGGYRYYEGWRSVAPHTCRQRVFGGARHAQPNEMLVKVSPAQKHVATARRQHTRLCQMLTQKDVWKQHTQDKHTGNTLRVAPCACFHSRPSRNASWGLCSSPEEMSTMQTDVLFRCRSAFGDY